MGDAASRTHRRGGGSERSTRPWWKATVASLCLVGLITACGDDDKKSDSTTATTASGANTVSTAAANTPAGGSTATTAAGGPTATQTGGSAAKPTGKPYQLGIVVSMTGPANALGIEEMDSYKLAVDLVNKAGGINGRPIEFKRYDDESDPKKAVTLVQRLISEDNVIGIIGGLSSSATLAVKPVVEEEHVALLSAHVAVATTEDDPKYLFRSAPSDAMTAEKMLEYIDEQGFKKIAIIHDSNAYGSGARDLVKKIMGEKYSGIELVGTEQYGNADTDMRTQLTSLRGTEPEALLVLGTGQGPALAIAQAAELGIKAKMIGGTGLISPATIKVAGQAADQMVAIGYGDAQCPRPEQEEFVKEFQAAYGKDPAGFNFLGDGMYLLLEAMKTMQPKSEDVKDMREAIRDSLEKINGLSWGVGPWAYAPDNHDGAGTDSLVPMVVKSGEWRRLDCKK